MHERHIAERFAALEGHGVCPSSWLRVEVARYGDYQTLSRYHYRSGPPATHVHTLVARRPEDGMVAGVLVVSMPTLSGAWRERAWPGRYGLASIRASMPVGCDVAARQEAAKRLNAEVRCISRVIVDPRWRGVGVAAKLVRAYLAAPLTCRTEAVSAMAAFSPFFITAGMRAMDRPPCARTRRLRSSMVEAGLTPIDLIDPARWRRAGSARSVVSPALERWITDTYGARGLGSRRERIAYAGSVLLAMPAAYVHDAEPRS